MKRLDPRLRTRRAGLHGETIVNEKREVYFSTGEFWHRMLPDGSPVYSCRACKQRAHNVTWKMMQDILLQLSPYPGERWDLICDGQDVLLVPPGTKHQGKPHTKRLVSIAYDPTYGLIFYSEKSISPSEDNCAR